MISSPAAGDIAVFACALRTTTERLACRLGGDLERPAWSGLEWRIAAAVCGLHGIGPLLHAHLDWDLPASFRGFLADQHRHAVARHERIRGMLGSLDRKARDAGIAVLALKGAALLARGVYAPGLRPMGDVDLLVDEERRAALIRLLGTLHYVPAFSSGRHDVLRPRDAAQVLPHRLGEHIDSPIKIEVHTRIAEALPVSSVDITAELRAGPRQPGIGDYPSDAALLAHLLLHAAGNMRARALRHLQLHDIALMSRRLSGSEWRNAVRSGLFGWWALPPLRLAARYYPATVPEPVLSRLAALCPARLRRHSAAASLTDVSWSQIRIEAFPGIEWSRDILDVCRYMRTRALPSRRALRELRRGAEEIPGVGEIPWYRLSHAARIARWIRSRPPRVQTLLSVQAALSCGDDAADRASWRV